MTKATVAAVQAAYVLMDREATLDKVEDLVGKAAADGADVVAFPEVFVPGQPLWSGEPEDDWDNAWYSMLVDQAVVVPSAATERLAATAREANVYLVIGVEERESEGSTIFNSVLYFGPDGSLLGKHRKLVPTGYERLFWGVGDGSTMETYPTPLGRLGGLICWENRMPLARFFVYSRGVDIWFAPTLSTGDGWIATLRHIAQEGGCYVVGINPCLHIDQIPQNFPSRDRVWTPSKSEGEQEWPEAGNSVIVGPDGAIIAGPARHEETILTAEVDLTNARAERNWFDPVGHYHRPDIFRLAVDTRPRPVVVGFEPFEEKANQE